MCCVILHNLLIGAPTPEEYNDDILAIDDDDDDMAAQLGFMFDPVEWGSQEDERREQLLTYLLQSAV